MVVKPELVGDAVAEAVIEAAAGVLLTAAMFVEALEVISTEDVAIRVAVRNVVGVAEIVELSKAPVTEAEIEAVALGALSLPDPPAAAMRAGPGIGYSVLAW